jgi:CubicO group peptidase (beta-lactamase class C family)
MVIGLIDEHGSQVFAGGALDNARRTSWNGDSVFYIRSITKTLTALLLQDMAKMGVTCDDMLERHPNGLETTAAYLHGLPTADLSDGAWLGVSG